MAVQAEGAAAGAAPPWELPHSVRLFTCGEAAVAAELILAKADD